jgi:hypothetical protein
VNKSIRIASADYETVHGLKSYSCTGTLYEKNGTYFLHERIKLSIDEISGNPVHDERSKPLTLQQAQGVLRDWQRLDIADVFVIPWE